VIFQYKHHTLLLEPDHRYSLHDHVEAPFLHICEGVVFSILPTAKFDPVHDLYIH
jgi:hypothetical protein